jgi:phosphoribosylamine--glycine ligase
MKVLVIGGGGREHALCWKLGQSSAISEVFCAPGNAGTQEVASNIDVSVDDVDALRDVARRTEAGLVIVGPEAPLVAGLGDALREDGVPVFGPGTAGAELEGSKAFAKDVMYRHGIPTAGYRVFDERAPAIEYLEGQVAWPVVVKASGLAAGKGVLICKDRDEAVAAVDAIMVERAFGESGATIVIEDFLSGEEASMHCVTDGETLFSLPTSQDYKRALEGDQGPNTGGMGATSPCVAMSSKRIEEVEEQVLFPTVHAVRRLGSQYRGMIYAGLMLTRSGPKVLEYNVRFGDPETQVILPRLKGDLYEILLTAAEGRLADLSDEAFDWDPRPAITVVLAAEGYPGPARRGDAIEGLEDAKAMKDVTVFHAGTASVAGRPVTSGGRVLGVTALGKDFASAQATAYAAIGKISFPGMQYRPDIGWRALAAEKNREV